MRDTDRESSDANIIFVIYKQPPSCATSLSISVFCWWHQVIISSRNHARWLHKLQSDLNRFSNLFNTLGLSLNLDKCKIVTLTISRSPVMSPHFINNVAITRVMDFFMDLGFKLSYNLDPTTHIKYVCCKALKTLGRVTRLIKDFRLESSLKSLFCALVRPIFKYGNLILQIMQGKLSVFSDTLYTS